MWADNGDILSKQYAGTGSTITSVTKNGNQGFLGMIAQTFVSVERFFVNNLEDDFKHECIKMVLNRHANQHKYGIRDQLEKKVLQHKDKFIKQTEIKTCIFTWNLAGNAPSSHFDISDLLNVGEQAPDIYIIGL